MNSISLTNVFQKIPMFFSIPPIWIIIKKINDQNISSHQHHQINELRIIKVKKSNNPSFSDLELEGESYS